MGFSIRRGLFGLAVSTLAFEGTILGGLTRQCGYSVDVLHAMGEALGYQFVVAALSTIFSAGIVLLAPTLVIALAGVLPFDSLDATQC